MHGLSDPQVESNFLDIITPTNLIKFPTTVIIPTSVEKISHKRNEKISHKCNTLFPTSVINMKYSYKCNNYFPQV